MLKEQACFLPLSPDGTPVIGVIPGTAKSLYVAGGESALPACCVQLWHANSLASMMLVQLVLWNMEKGSISHRRLSPYPLMEP